MKTYLFSGDGGCGDGCDWSKFYEILSLNGYSPYPDSPHVAKGQLLLMDSPCNIPFVNLLVVDNFADKGYDPNAYSIKCDWLSRHDAESIYPIVRKDVLHSSLHGSSFIAETYPLEEFAYSEGVYILRPSHMLAQSGIDIMIIDSVETFHFAREFYERKISAHLKYHKKHMQYYKVIVSRYISAPMLFEGRKFHLRLYGINLSTEAGFWLSRHGEILTAALPFAMHDFGNKDIHDTHFNSTPKDYLYPDDFPRQDLLPHITSQLDEIAAAISPLSTPVPYNQSHYSFQVYGVDFMIDEGGKVYLIEINPRPGLRGKDIRNPKLRERFSRHSVWLASFLKLNI